LILIRFKIVNEVDINGKTQYLKIFSKDVFFLSNLSSYLIINQPKIFKHPIKGNVANLMTI